MAAMAEALVDEWLNRQGFFTIRGLKDGVDEIDLLAVRLKGKTLEAWHVEVQASFRPIGYISKVPKELEATFKAKGASIKKRPPEVLKKCVETWVQGKFMSKKKAAMREKAWPGLTWKHFLVHGESRWPEELGFLAGAGITLKPLFEVLQELHGPKKGGLRGGAGTDISEMIEYFQAHATGVQHINT